MSVEDLSPRVDNDIKASDGWEGVHVLQCSKCHIVLGDTITLRQDEAGTSNTGIPETVALRAAANVVVALDPTLDTNPGVTAGCTFFIVGCSNCHAHVGRVYLATPAHLDHLRNIFTFSEACIVSYQLGCGDPFVERDLTRRLDVKRNQQVDNAVAPEVNSVDNARRVSAEPQLSVRSATGATVRVTNPASIRPQQYTTAPAGARIISQPGYAAYPGPY